MEKRRRFIIAILLMLTIGDFTRLKGNETIRPIQFILIFLIGGLTALLVNEFVTLFKAKRL